MIRSMEPTESQYLVINSLLTLELLLYDLYDSETGLWYINTPSTMLPIACVMPDGEIQPVELLS